MLIARTLAVSAFILSIAQTAYAVPVTLTYTLAPGSLQSVIPGGNPASSGSFSITLNATGLTACLTGGPLAPGAGACLHTFSFATTSGATAHIGPVYWPSPAPSNLTPTGPTAPHSVSFFASFGTAAPDPTVRLNLFASAGVVSFGFLEAVNFAIGTGATLTSAAIYFVGAREVPEPTQPPLLATGLMLLAPYFLIRWRRRYS